MKRLIFLVAALCAAAPAYAGLCSLLSKDLSCSFASDTSGGVAIFQNPSNLTNVGSGVVTPFLGLQANGSEAGVSTDTPNVNLLPLNGKRDNVNTFTTTLTRSVLQVVTVNGIAYYSFFGDFHEPNGGVSALLSLDSLLIFGAIGPTAADPLLLTTANVSSLGDLDLFPNLEPVYRLGIGNTLLLDADLFAGQGLGTDLNILIPVSLFDLAGIGMNSRIAFAAQFGMAGAVIPGAESADGFEELLALIGPNPLVVSEPASIALLALGLLSLGFLRRRAS